MRYPGSAPVAAAIIIAEIGLDMTRFPTAGHLCSWAKFAPMAPTLPVLSVALIRYFVSGDSG